MKVSVLIPCYDERPTIERILARVSAAPVDDKEVIVIDDGSTDGTREFLTEHADELGIRLELHPENRGKGAAIRTGIALATGDIVLIQDADLEYDPRDFAPLLEAILDGRADVVYGTRLAGGGPPSGARPAVSHAAQIGRAHV